MTATKRPTSMQFTALVDIYNNAGRSPMEIVGMTFRGTGLTAGQALTITEGVAGNGDFLADYVVGATIDNADLWCMKPPRVVSSGISFANGTVSGDWVVTVFLR